MNCILKKALGRRNCRKCEEICKWKIEPIKSYRKFLRLLLNISPSWRGGKRKNRSYDEENI